MAKFPIEPPPTCTQTQESQEGKYLLRRHRYVIMLKSTPRCGLQLLPHKKKKLKKNPAPGSVALPTTTTADSPNSLHPSAAPPAAPLRLESRPPKCTEQSPLRHVKTIFLLDWQINFLLPAQELGQKPKYTVAAGVHFAGGGGIKSRWFVCLL